MFYHRRWFRYIQSILLVALATAIGLPLHSMIEPGNLVMLFLMAVVISATYLGRGPSLLASFLSALVFDFFFVEPHLSLTVKDTQYLLTLFGLLLVSLVISSLAGLVREQVETSRQREAEASALYALAREVAVAFGLDSVFKVVTNQIGQALSSSVIILMPSGSRLVRGSSTPGYVFDETEQALADWAFSYDQKTGHGTANSPDARSRYLPLRTAHGVIGVLGVCPLEGGRFLSRQQLHLLDGFASLAALAVERAQLAEQASQAQVLRATEKLQTTLLNSISHDLRTPLASITGVLSSLREAEGAGNALTFDPSARADLIETAWEEAGRLNRLVGNLLDMTRMELGTLKVHREAIDVQDLVGTALAQLRDRVENRPVQISIPLDLPMVLADFVLITQVLVNLLDNALKYSPPGSPIEIGAALREPVVTISVADRGIGIPEEDLGRVFDKFYRVQRRTNVGGTGLGLSICKGIVEANGGSIWVENRPGGGVEVSFTLPANLEGNEGTKSEQKREKQPGEQRGERGG